MLARLKWTENQMILSFGLLKVIISIAWIRLYFDVVA